MKRYVVGDIHGGYRGLKQCLELAKFDYENDQLISIGDLCDGWSEVHLVVQELLKIKNLVLLKGNHDDWALRNFLHKMTDLYDKRSWMSQGGLSTLNSYEAIDDKQKEEFINLLASAVPFYIDDKNNLFVHGGYNHVCSIEDKDYTPEWEQAETLMWDRTYWDNVYGGFYDKDPRFNKIYIGHTPTITVGSSIPLNINNVWNIDTGAAYYGPLSLVDIDTNEVWQSDYIFRLYPDERGRNTMSYNKILENELQSKLHQFDIFI